jgi:hypothetical protein
LKQALINMLSMQHKMNTRVHPEWIGQCFEWYRAIWMECGELIDHYGYKWWKKQEPDMPQVQLEVVDIWHFGLSALFCDDKSVETLGAELNETLLGHQASGLGVRDATEALALHSLQTQGFSPTLFLDLLYAADMDFTGLYTAYIGKNVLNFFRQDHGYKDGSYIKQWAGREDNEHLVELLLDIDSAAEDFSEQVYAALLTRYREVAVPA